jgi:hypothetical protein
MITFHNPHHALHQGKRAMFRGQLVPCFEVPAGVDYVHQELQRRQRGEIMSPLRFDVPVLTSIHAPLAISRGSDFAAVNLLEGFQQHAA